MVTIPRIFGSLHRPALAALLLAAMPSGVQSQEGGGVLLTFGIEQMFRSQSNPSLNIPSSGTELQARTKLSFGLVSETRTQRLAFGANGTFVAGQAARTGFILPSAELSYSRSAASSQLELSAFTSRKDVDTLEFVTSDDPINNPILIAVTGSGTQQVRGAMAKLSFGQGLPFGGSVSVRVAKTSYSGTTDPNLVDSRRDTARLALHFDFTDVTTVNAGLSVSRLDEAVLGTNKQTETLSLGLNHTLPTGSLSLDGNAAHDNAGTRYSLSFGRRLELPRGELNASVGLTWPITGRTQVTGALDWRHDLPNGVLSARVSRSVTSDARDQEVRVDRLDATLERALLPRLNGAFTVGLQDSNNSGTGVSTKSTRLDASLKYELTQDWGLRFGAQHRILNTQGSGKAKSTTLSVTLGRTFEYLP